MVTRSSPSSSLAHSSAAAADCWALGYGYSYSPQIPIQAFAEHWDGVAWSIVLPQSIDGKDAYLMGVSCVSASDCWAETGTPASRLKSTSRTAMLLPAATRRMETP